MPRIRTIKPEAWGHRKVGRLSRDARVLWVVMITQADDEGRLVADPGQLRLVAFGYDQDIGDAKVAELLAEIAATGLVGLYQVRAVPYAFFPSWKDHQHIDRPNPSKLPVPPGLRSATRRRSLADASTTRRGAPHMAVNASTAARYHLVVDKFLDPELRTLLEAKAEPRAGSPRS